MPPQDAIDAAQKRAEEATQKSTIKDYVTHKPIADALREIKGFEDSFVDVRNSGVDIVLGRSVTEKDLHALKRALRNAGLANKSDVADMEKNRDINGLRPMELDELLKANKSIATYDLNIHKTSDGYGVSINLHGSAPNLGGGTTYLDKAYADKSGILSYEGAQKIANNLRDSQGKPPLPIKKLSEIELPDYKTVMRENEKNHDKVSPPAKANPEEVVRALNRKYGPEGFTFELQNDNAGKPVIVSTAVLNEKQKDLFMKANETIRSEEKAGFFISAKHIEEDGKTTGYKLSLPADGILEKDLNNFKDINEDTIERKFKKERDISAASIDNPNAQTTYIFNAKGMDERLANAGFSGTSTTLTPKNLVDALPKIINDKGIA